MQLTPAATSAAAGNREPSKTWRIDFEKKRISGTIDGLDALRQAVFLCLSTERYEHVIFSFDYGVESKGMEGRSYNLVQTELQSAIEDALSADERITGVSDFAFSRTNSGVNVTFSVAGNSGSFTMEVNANV